MYAVTNSFAHRAPPATRTRVRWQPYSALSSSSSTASSSSNVSCRSPQSTYLNTPASSVSTPPSVNVSNDPRHTTPSLSHTSKEQQSRDANKQKYALSLVDQAVKTLSDIWHPQDIPSVFLTSSRATVPPTPPPLQTPSKLLRDTCRRNVQLPSPISPSTREPPSPPSTPSPTSRKSDDNRIADTSASANTQHGLVPIKGFVHEVLRRSRTSACVLQTALCYLEAIRSKVPELVRQEALGEGIQGEPETQSRVISASDLDHAANCEYLQDSASMEQDVIPTVRVNDCGSFDTSVPDIQGLGKKVSPPVSPLPPMAPLPSPLLCPRRAFLASLILASKFTQDKCYSNRAWAKLSGLAPREIGRCERALGDALDWRLWVGKVPQPAPAPPVATRPVVRTRSDGAILFTAPKLEIVTPDASPTDLPPTRASLITSNHRGLRRCATLPADANMNGVSNWVNGANHIMHASASSASISDAGDSNAWLWNEQTPMETTAPREIEDSVTQSPIPSTPPLTLSPSSTESSSGDRTIQMSFLDDVCSFCDSNNTPGSGPAWSVVGEAWSSVSFCPIHGANGLASLGFRKHDLPKPPPTVNDLSGLSKTIPMEITNEYTGIATLAPDISSL
ncbi:Cyclin N-terminal domain-containing protein [Pleurotus pulmonarius]